MDSLAEAIDYWVIVDTGSTDDTVEKIQRYFSEREIPGELHQRPWVNFTHNRNEALRLAEHKANYILFCDADMQLAIEDPSWKSQLGDAHGYYILNRKDGSGFSYRNLYLIDARLNGEQRWRYRMPTHEYIDSELPGKNHLQNFDGISFRDYSDGGSKADKFLRDEALLKAYIVELEAEQGTRVPDDESAAEEERQLLYSRSLFYLAQTYRDMGQQAQAIEYYRRCAAATGWHVERWYSLFQIALLQMQSGAEYEQVLSGFLLAYQILPSRAEPLYWLARYLRTRKQYALATLFVRRAAEIPLPEDVGFVDASIYQWRAKDELALNLYYSGERVESKTLWEALLGAETSALPEQQRLRIQENLSFFNKPAD